MEVIFNLTLVTSKVSLPTVGVPRKPDDWRLKQFFISSSIFVLSSLSINLSFYQQLTITLVVEVDSSPYYKEEDKYREKYKWRQIQMKTKKRQIHYLGGGGGNKDGLGEVIFFPIGRGCGRNLYHIDSSDCQHEQSCLFEESFNKFADFKNLGE